MCRDDPTGMVQHGTSAPNNVMNERCPKGSGVFICNGLEEAKREEWGW